MLLLLLGIIVLHVTVLVLLFVSTIVSVSTGFPCSGLPRGRDMAWHEQELFLFISGFTAWLLAARSLYCLVAGLSNSRIREFVMAGKKLGCVLWWVPRARGLLETILLNFPRLVHIKEQPRSTQNPLLWGDAALPFHKGAPPAIELHEQDQKSQSEKAPKRGWLSTESSAQQFCSQLSSFAAWNKAQPLFPNATSKTESV